MLVVIHRVNDRRAGECVEAAELVLPTDKSLRPDWLAGRTPDSRELRSATSRKLSKKQAGGRRTCWG